MTHVTIEANQSSGSEIGAEHLEMPWNFSFGRVAALRHTIQNYLKNCAAVCVNISSICLSKGFAPLRGACTVEAPYGLRMGCTLLQLEQGEKHLRMSQYVFQIRASQPRSLWNVHSQHSSWNQTLLCLALDFDFADRLVVVRDPSFQATASRSLSRRCVWLASHDREGFRTMAIQSKR